MTPSSSSSSQPANKLIFSLMIVFLGSRNNKQNVAWAIDSAYRLNNLCKDGNIILGGLFSLHSSSPIVKEHVTEMSCDAYYQHSVVLTEAMIYAIQQINADKRFFYVNRTKVISLGYNIQGTCDDTTDNMVYALDAFTQLELRMQQFSRRFPSNNDGDKAIKNPLFASPIKSSSSSSAAHGTGRIYPNGNICRFIPYAALIGPSTTTATTSVASLFRLYKIPVISYDASSPELGDHTRFPSFFRTIYADDKQAEALADLVRSLGWNYISVVGSDDTVGRQGIYQFKKYLWQKAESCIAKEYYFGSDEQLGRIIKHLESVEREPGTGRTNVTLLFMPWAHAHRFLSAVQNTSLVGSTFIGVDDWTSNVSMTMRVSDFMPWQLTEGMLSTQIPRIIPMDFLKWMSAYLQRQLMNDIPLFNYFCQQCSLRLHGVRPSRNQTCDPSFVTSQKCLNTINIALIIQEQRRITNVITAVYSAAYALHQMWTENKLQLQYDGKYWISYDELTEAISQLNISKIPVLCPGTPPIRFDENGDLKGGRFEIHNFYHGPRPSTPGSQLMEEMGLRSRRSSSCTQRSAVKLKSNATGAPANESLVGYWDERNGVRLNQSLIRWKGSSHANNGQGGGIKPTSSCSDPCRPGQKTVYSPNECCWSCQNCPKGEWSNGTNSIECYPCGLHHHTNWNQTACIRNTFLWTKLSDGMGIVNVFLCALGLTFVVVSGILSFWKRHDPYLNENTLKTCLLFNCALCYIFILFHNSEPTLCRCAIRRVVTQTGYTGHCIAFFFSTDKGRELSIGLARRCCPRIPVPKQLCPSLAYAVLTLIGFLYYSLVSFGSMSDIQYTDLGLITGTFNTTYVDCGFGIQSLGGIITLVSFCLYAGSFLTASLYIAFRTDRVRRQSLASTQRQMSRSKTSQTTRVTKFQHLHVRLILYSSYVAILTSCALFPLYATTRDPVSKNWIFFMGSFAVNTNIIGLFIIPRAHKVLRNELKANSRRDSLGGVFIISSGGGGGGGSNGDQTKNNRRPSSNSAANSLSS